MAKSNKAISDYWRGLYARFNAPVRRTGVKDMQEDYSRGMDRGEAAMRQDVSRVSNTGGFSVGDTMNRARQNAGMRAAGQTEGFARAAFGTNAGRSTEKSIGDFEKMNRLAEMDRRMNVYLPQDRESTLKRVKTNIGRMKRMDSLGEQSPWMPFAMAAGNIGGAALGKWAAEKAFAKEQDQMRSMLGLPPALPMTMPNSKGAIDPVTGMPFISSSFSMPAFQDSLSLPGSVPSKTYPSYAPPGDRYTPEYISQYGLMG